MCEQLGQEPDPEKMPLEESDFPDEVQVAFFVHSLLTDCWEGMSGSYLGKNYEEYTLIVELFDISEAREIFMLVKRYDAHLMNYRAEEQEKKRKRDEQIAKQKASAKNGNLVTNVVSGQ